MWLTSEFCGRDCRSERIKKKLIQKNGKDWKMEMENGKFIFTAEELRKLIEMISFQAHEEGIIDAERQMKEAIEAENDGTFQFDADGEASRWNFEDVG